MQSEPVGILFQHGRIVIPSDELGKFQYRSQVGNVGFDTGNFVFIQRPPHPFDRKFTRCGPNDQLADHRIVMHRNLILLIDITVKTDSDPARFGQLGNHPRRRHKTRRGIFGTNPALDGVAPLDNIALGKAQRPPVGDKNLLLDQIDPAHLFGDRMLDLQARVHLEEIVIALPVHQEFDRSGSEITDRTGRSNGITPHTLPQLRSHQGRRTLFDDFLVAALHGALPLAQVDHMAEPVSQHLEFDVVRLFDKPFDVDGIVAERSHRLGTGSLKSFAHVRFPPHQPHTLSASALRRLQHHRKTDPAAHLDGLISRHKILLRAGHYGNPGFDHRAARRNLIAHQLDRFGRGANKNYSRFTALAGERGVFGQKTVTGMDRVGTASAGHLQNPVPVQVALLRSGAPYTISLIGIENMPRSPVRLGKDRYGNDPHFPAGTHHPQSDLPAIGNQYLPDHNFQFNSQAVHGSIYRSRQMKLRQSAYQTPTGSTL